MQRVVDIATDKCHLARSRGFLTIQKDDAELGRVALDDIAALILHGHATTLSANILTALAERDVVTVLCGPNHMPHSAVMPLGTYHLQGARMIAQAAARATLKKRIWQRLIIAKITMQACMLRAVHAPLPGLDEMAKRVKSGDPDNIEAQAARRYWPKMMGEDFIRDRAQPGVNGLLNYGYIILRATCARAIVAAGLNPALGVHHHAGPNNAALADDLMEPFRPLVDLAVWHLKATGVAEVSAEAKRVLAGLLDIDLPGPEGASPVGVCIRRAAQSLGASFDGSENLLALPTVPDPLQLGSIASLVASHASS